MKIRFAMLVMAVILIGAVRPGDAQQEKKSPATMLDAVVVTATKVDDDFRTGDVDQDTTPVMTTTIERVEFEGKIENIDEIIEKEAGVQVRQSGGLGAFSSVSLRGASSEQVMVFMDGILLNDASGGGVDLSNIALGDVAAIEIYRGATPINFGSSSIGGAVNIRTLRAEKGLKVNASAGYGSFNSQKANVFANHKPGRFDYLVSVDYLASDNDFEFTNDRGTDWNPDDDIEEKRNNAQVEQGNVLAKAGFDFSKDLRLDLMNQTFIKEQGIPNWINSPLNRTTLDTLRNISTLRLTADNLTNAGINTGTQLSYTFKEEEYDDQGGHIGLGKQSTTYTTGRVNLDLFAQWLGERQDLIGTVNLLHEDYEAENHLQNTNPGESHRDTLSLGLQDSFFFFGQTLIVTPAARYTWNDDELASGASAFGDSGDDRSRSDDYLTPQIGVLYGPFSWLKLKSNLAKYVRQPSFFELFGDRGLFTGNSELKAEKGVNFDVGAQCDWEIADRWLQRLRLGAAYFRTDAEDLITRTYDARGIGKSVNISGALIQGIEVEGSIEFLHHFRAVGKLTYQDPENQSEIEAFDGKRLSGRFETAILGRLEAFYAGFRIYGELTGESGIYYDTANLRPAPDKEEINAGISYTAGPWRFQVEGKNLADKQYEDFNGFPLPGRSFFASIMYNFSTRKIEK